MKLSQETKQKSKAQETVADDKELADAQEVRDKVQPLLDDTEDILDGVDDLLEAHEAEMEILSDFAPEAEQEDEEEDLVLILLKLFCGC